MKTNKRGEATMLTNLLWIGAALLFVGGVIAVIVIILSNQSDNVSEQADSVSGSVAVYSPTCNENLAQRAGTISIVLEAPVVANSNLNLAYNRATGGYAQPTGVVGTTGTKGAFGTGNTPNTPSNTEGRFGVTGGTAATGENVAFLSTIDNVTEARYNADFNGDGDIDDGEVVAIIANEILNIDTTSAQATAAATIAGATPILAADAGVDIPNATAGSRLIVNRVDGCWGIA